MMRTRSRRRRAGLSLLEAIVAVGIFVGSMALIGQLLDTGLRTVDMGTRETIGLLRCESRMEEIVAGIVPIDTGTAAAGTPDLDDPHWRTTVLAEPTPVEGLLRVTVVVDYLDNPESAEAEESQYSQSLTRLVVDPSLLSATQLPTERATGTITIPQMLGLPSGGGMP